MASGEDKDMSHMEGMESFEHVPEDPTVGFFKTGMLIAVIIGVIALPINSPWTLAIAAFVAAVVIVVSVIMILCRMVGFAFKRIFHIGD